jgi:hypothetical protein
MRGGCAYEIETPFAIADADSYLFRKHPSRNSPVYIRGILMHAARHKDAFINLIELRH